MIGEQLIAAPRLTGERIDDETGAGDDDPFAARAFRINFNRQTKRQTTNLGVRSSNLFGRAREFNDLVELGAAVPGRGVTIRVTADISRVAELWCRPFE